MIKWKSCPDCTGGQDDCETCFGEGKVPFYKAAIEDVRGRPQSYLYDHNKAKEKALEERRIADAS